MIPGIMSRISTSRRSTNDTSKCHFLTLLDTGILMTFGSGANGCLGHGNLLDVKEVDIVVFSHQNTLLLLK